MKLMLVYTHSQFSCMYIVVLSSHMLPLCFVKYSIVEGKFGKINSKLYC